jgi:hypothetical protein
MAAQAAKIGPTTAQQQQGFVKALSDYFAKRGQPYPGSPKVDGRAVDIARLFAVISKLGGYDSVRSPFFSRFFSRPPNSLLAGQLESVMVVRCQHSRLPYAARNSATPARTSPSPPSGSSFPSFPFTVDSRTEHFALQGYQSTLLGFEQMWTALQQQRQAQTQQPAVQSALSTSASSTRPGTASTPAPPFTAPSPAQSISAAPQSLPSTSQPFAPSSSVPPQNPNSTTIDFTGSASPFAANGQRPSTATSQREGTAPPRTAGEGSMPPPAFGMDLKGKGKALDDGLLSVKGAFPSLTVLSSSL